MEGSVGIYWWEYHGDISSMIRIRKNMTFRVITGNVTHMLYYVIWRIEPLWGYHGDTAGSCIVNVVILKSHGIPSFSPKSRKGILHVWTTHYLLIQEAETFSANHPFGSRFEYWNPWWRWGSWISRNNHTNYHYNNHINEYYGYNSIETLVFHWNPCYCHN